mgnify:CR=1 FL=1
MRSLSSRAGNGPWATGFDHDALAEIATGDNASERDWALATLLLLLDRGDPRAPGGLAALGSADAVAPLQEAAARTSDDAMSTAIATALQALTNGD